MKILLVWPNSRNEVLGWGDLGAVAEPLSLEYLAAGAKLDGHDVEVLDLRLHPGELSQALERFAPDVVGLTAFSMHVRTALSICKVVKEALPECCTVRAAIATLHARRFLRAPGRLRGPGRGRPSVPSVASLSGSRRDRAEHPWNFGPS